MYLAVAPEHLPVIAAQLGVSMEDLILMLGAAAPAAVPAPPGLDDVSALIEGACVNQAALFFRSTAAAAALGIDGTVELPKVGVAFAEGDLRGGAQILSRSAAFGE
ncbi:hypothetical protein AB0M45_31900 [Nocardia sp. NPDC051787]|uniref:hypothetical protein n=1 Tax=Nocardia sp. NPDC051787 TaxID=3155415 RepID=UPI0034207EE9